MFTVSAKILAKILVVAILVSSASAVLHKVHKDKGYSRLQPRMAKTDEPRKPAITIFQELDTGPLPILGNKHELEARASYAAAPCSRWPASRQGIQLHAPLASAR